MNTFESKWLVGTLAAMTLVSACKKEEAPAAVESQAEKGNAPAAMPAAVGPAAGSVRFVPTNASSAQFLIDAPLEKIKGVCSKFRGELDIDPANLKKSVGKLELDVADLRTETFDDAGKNAKQTEHARNWMEVGADVDQRKRDENRWARFTIRSIDEVNASSVESSSMENGQHKVLVTASGDMMLHGVTSPKKVKLSVVFEGPAASPTSVHLKTLEPLRVSLKEHDIKPRDLAGKFLNGALEQIGQKIDDAVQVSLDVTAAVGR